MDVDTGLTALRGKKGHERPLKLQIVDSYVDVSYLQKNESEYLLKH